MYRILVGKPREGISCGRPRITQRDRIKTGVKVMTGSQMVMTGSESHLVVDFGNSSVESLPYATMKLHNYLSNRKTASGLCQSVISDIKMRKVSGTSGSKE
jgi:hypothetical protein